MDIRQVRFCGAALRRSERPRDWYPQVAVAGRSNVGKSSLLNWLFRQNVARVAKAPGKTRSLNFFLVNEDLYLVDLPGYGYAKVNRRLKEDWERELGRYLAEEERLAGVITLLDVRRGPTELDSALQDFLLAAGRERVVVLTKADKVGRGQRSAMRLAVQRSLGLTRPPLVVSVRTGEGRRELLETIDELARTWRKRQRGV